MATTINQDICRTCEYHITRCRCVNDLIEDEDGELVCQHSNAYIDPPCCPAGTRDCGCMGSGSIECPNPHCTGIKDWEIDGLLDRLEQWER